MLLEVGRIDKAHGVAGEVLVTLHADREERVAPGAQMNHDGGTFTVQASRRHQHRWLVKFAEITDRDAANAARGTVLFGEPADDPDVLWVHELVDQTVVDRNGAVLGTVEAVEQNPASDLLVVASGLIPLTFLVERLADGTIVVDPPEGLLDG